MTFRGTHLAARLEAGGYLQLSGDGLAAGSGRYELSPEQLARYRNAVAADRTGEELTALIERIEKTGAEVLGRGTLKTVPRGFPKDHPRVELLRHKGLVAWQSWPPARWLDTPAAKKRIVDFFRASRPLRLWLDDNLGV